MVAVLKKIKSASGVAAREATINITLDAEHLIGRHHQPVEHHGFLIPQFAVEDWHNPISALHHFSRTTCVARFVAIPQLAFAKLNKEDGRGDQDDQR